MKILGISALYHDSAAAICVDGEIVAAAQEERFTRIRHDPSLPGHAARYCLREAGFNAEDLDLIVYYDNPLLTLDRWLSNCSALGDRAHPLIKKNFETTFSNKLWIHDAIQNSIGLGKHGKLVVADHHVSHASSAFYPSPFTDAAILTVDGVGEWATTTISEGRQNKLETIRQINYPHSLGLLYSAFTYFCGFKVNSGEYKLMGLSPYGEPKYYLRIREHLIDVKDDGSFRLNLDYFRFHCDDSTITDDFGGLFDGPRREPESRIGRREVDLAASIQKVTEEVMLKLANHAKHVTGSKNLCLAGGVALNCVANGKISAACIFDRIWIQPAAGDAGGAIGAALYAEHALFDTPRKVAARDGQKGSYLGPAFDSFAVRARLDERKAKYLFMPEPAARSRRIAELLAQDKVVGFFSGRMEFGPRALGGRSILGNPMSSEMQRKLNLKIKLRESFRPFAPAVLKERASDYFEFNGESPYMLMTVPLKEALRKPFSMSNILKNEASDFDLLEVVNMVRSSLPAITHVDFSARIQTVSKDDHPFFHSVLSDFERLTGCAVLVNTSFNVRGEPIVCTPADAYLCFMRTDMDVLMLEDFILFKEDQPPLTGDENWRSNYELD